MPKAFTRRTEVLWKHKGVSYIVDAAYSPSRDEVQIIDVFQEVPPSRAELIRLASNSRTVQKRIRTKLNPQPEHTPWDTDRTTRQAAAKPRKSPGSTTEETT